MTDADRVLAMLRNAGATQPDMAFVLGISTRKVQECIVELRLAGHPVVSDGDGVRLAKKADEVKTCAEALRRRLVSQYVTVRAMRRTARRMADKEAYNATLWDRIGRWA